MHQLVAMDIDWFLTHPCFCMVNCGSGKRASEPLFLQQVLVIRMPAESDSIDIFSKKKLIT